MTENKRFTVDGLTITENSPKGRKYLLEHQGGVNALCNRINGLFDKSKRLEKENEQLKAQLYCDSNEGVCSICKHHYLEKTNMFYISKCEKGHEKCSTDALKHCKDFELKELQE